MIFRILLVLSYLMIIVNYCFSQNSLFQLDKKIIFRTKDGKKDGVIGKLQDLIIDKDKNIYILDSFDLDVKKFSKDGVLIKTFGKKGAGPGEMYRPAKIALDNNGNIYLSDGGNRRMNIYTNNGEFIYSFRVHLPHARDLKINSKGELFYLARDYVQEKMIHKFTQKGELLKSFAQGFEHKERFMRDTYSMGHLYIDNMDNVYYTPETFYKIFIYNSNEKLVKTFERNAIFFKKPRYKTRSNGTPLFDIKYTMSTGAYVYNNNYIFNIIRILEANKAIIDIFDLNGNLIKGEIPVPATWFIYFEDNDKQDFLWFIIFNNENPDPIAVKYSLNITQLGL